MKILTVDLQYDYGNPSRGPNLIGEVGFRQSLVSLGHQVSMFYYDGLLGDLPKLQSEVLAAADREKPDLIFFMLFRDQFAPETLDRLKERYVTMNWFGDDTWRFEGFTSKYAPHFSWCVTTDKFSVPRYHEVGQKNVIVSQWAAINHYAIPKHDGTYDYDVSFVGEKHTFRAWFVQELRKRGIRVDCFGRGWPSGSVSGEEMNRIFCRSRINLNLPNSLSYDLRYMMAHPKNLLHTVRSKKNRSQIKARNFEIPYFGGFQLTDYVPSIEDYFAIGREIACYKDVDEAETVIRYYLANEAERERIRRAGHEASAGRHGYVNRLHQIFLDAGLTKK